ncbi:MAG TPA: pimeloyl-CoA dehydrogenase small subunit [Gammaproteobacteria bacterium]|nr:pimeloyl-CoA dehydrogenase small subunit [Gammaproteobacteria bacterium]
MDFSLSDEQRIIKEAAEKFIAKDYTFDARNKIISSDEGMSRETWQQFADFGWLGIALPEEVGGYGGSMIETMIITEALGSAMVIEPFLSTVVMCASLIQQAGNSTQKEELLPKIIEGNLLLSLAFVEEQSRYNLADVATSAEKSGDDYVINGTKVVALGAPWADKLILSVRTSGNRTDTSGISLFLIDKSAPGVTCTDYALADGSQGANILLENVSVSKDALIGELDQGLTILEDVIDRATAALCADALGAMEACFKKTLEYVKTRKQFDVAIGSFQVLQHRVVDMFTAVESSRSMAYMVSMKINVDDAIERKKAVSAAKAHIGKHARFVSQQAVQLHGGIGMTEELDIGHYFRRLTLFCRLFGSTEYHIERFAKFSQI